MTILVIFALNSIRKLYRKIANYLKIPNLIITKILQLASKNLNILYCNIKLVVQFIRLNTQFQRILMDFIM